jgi:hypothetical protein
MQQPDVLRVGNYYQVAASGMVMPTALYDAIAFRDTRTDCREPPAAYDAAEHARQLVDRYGADHVFWGEEVHAADERNPLFRVYTHTLATLAAACGCVPELVHELHRLGSPWLLPTRDGFVACPLPMPFDMHGASNTWLDRVRRLIACGLDVNAPLAEGYTILAQAMRDMRPLDDIRELVHELGCDIGAACIVRHVDGTFLAPAFLANLCVYAARDAWTLKIVETAISAVLRLRPWPVDALWGDECTRILVRELRTYPLALRDALARFLRPQQMRAYCVAMHGTRAWMPVEVCNAVYDMTIPK